MNRDPRVGDAGLAGARRWPLAAVVAATVLMFAAAPLAAGLLPDPWDKLAHFVGFVLIGAALALGLGPSRVLLAFILAVAIGAGDELHQLWVPGREADLGDLAADVVAAALAIALTHALAWRGRLVITNAADSLPRR